MSDEHDPGLRQMLRLWGTPPVPDGLDQRVLASYRAGVAKESLWRRFFCVSIQVPLPVAVAAAILLVVTAVFALRRGPAAPEQMPPLAEATLSAGRLDVPVVTRTSLQGFEPVSDMNVTVVPQGLRP
jgi:hypothetical protein